MEIKNDLPIGFEMSLNEVLKERYNRALELQKQKPKDRDENNPELSRYEVTEKSVLVCDDGLICSYCEQGLGSYHKKKCDHICKDVFLRAAIEYTTDVPALWSEDKIRKYNFLKDESCFVFRRVGTLKILNIGEPYFSGHTDGDGSGDVSCYWCSHWRGNLRIENCNHICKDVKIREVVEYIITVPSTWKEDEVEVYAELEGRRMGLFDYLELKKVLEVSKTYFDEEFRTHLL